MASILVTDKISSDAISALSEKHEVTEFLDRKPADLNKKIKGFEVLIVRSRTKVTKELIDSADNLKIIARAGAGLDNVDKKYAESKGIQVINTPTANLLSVAELTLGLALSFLRNVPRADKGIKEGKWEKKDLRGVEVSGKTWGILGFGKIGQLLVGLLQGFKCNILICDPNLSEEVVAAYGVTKVSLEQLMKDSDIISIHVPLLDSTKGLVGAKELGMMKKSAIIINISRGGIIDEKALYKALKDNKIGGACLDVFEEEPPKGSPLLKLKNTAFTCHIGAQTIDAQKRVGEQLVERLLDALS